MSDSRQRTVNRRIDDLFPVRRYATLTCPNCSHSYRYDSITELARAARDYRDGCPDCGHDYDPVDVHRIAGCRVCGREIPSDTRLKRYCSRRCRAIARAVQRMFTWTTVREHVLGRDGWTCQSCGVNVGEDAEASAEVDHIRPLADGGRPLDESNLITLCSVCHDRKTNGDAPDTLGISDGNRPRRLAPQDYVDTTGLETQPAEGGGDD